MLVVVGVCVVLPADSDRFARILRKRPCCPVLLWMLPGIVMLLWGDGGCWAARGIDGA